MKNLKNQIKNNVSKLIGEAAVKLGDYEGGSLLLIIDEPKIPNEIMNERKERKM